MAELVIKNLHVSIEGKEILKGLDLTVGQGEVHAIMGPNGTGKSTLAYTLMGHPSYEVTEGEVNFKGQNILELEPDDARQDGYLPGFPIPGGYSWSDSGEFLAHGGERAAESCKPRG